jgi:hypothetical protein
LSCLFRDTHVFLLTRLSGSIGPNFSGLSASVAASSLQPNQCDLSLEEEIFC